MNCFLGTILQGLVQINDEIEIPSIKAVKKVKSIQMFRQPVNQASQGDRIGVCVTQFDPKSLERGLASKPNLLNPIYSVILDINRVRFYSKAIVSRKTKFHITIGHETILSNVLLFHGNCENFDFKSEYQYLDEFDKDCGLKNIFGLLEFERFVLIPPDAWIIGAKLDLEHSGSSCRMAFYGKVRYAFDSKNYKQEILPQLKVSFPPFFLVSSTFPPNSIFFRFLKKSLRRVWLNASWMNQLSLVETCF